MSPIITVSLSAYSQHGVSKNSTGVNVVERFRVGDLVPGADGTEASESDSDYRKIKLGFRQCPIRGIPSS
jgi:hypothetical protein